MSERLSSGFSTSDGVFVKALDTALRSFNVERQAYYGGTFIGNHVHSALEVTILTANNFLSKYHYNSLVTASWCVQQSLMLQKRMLLHFCPKQRQ